MRLHNSYSVCKFLLFLCLAGGTHAAAGEIVPWLTGNMSVGQGVQSGQYFQLGSVSGLFITNLPALSLYPLDYGNCAPTVLQGCFASATGSLTGFSFIVGILLQNGTFYQLLASFTSGTYSADGTLSINPQDGSSLLYFEEEYDSGFFAGDWNNGWKSTGQLDGYFSNSNAPPRFDWNGGGSIVTTTTPEPSTLFMFGAGLGGFAGLLRRKLMP